MLKIFVILPLILSGFLFYGRFYAYAVDQVIAVSGSIEDQLELKAPYVTPTGPVQEQKYVIPVSGIKDANPGVYWVQRDSGDWSATSSRVAGGKVIVSNVGTDKDPWPGVEVVPDKIDMNRPVYQPESFIDKNRSEYPPRLVTNAHIAKAETIDRYQGNNSQIIELEVKDMYYVLITSLTGEIESRESSNGLYREEYNRPQKDENNNDLFRPGGQGYPKKTALYITPLNLEWRGTIVEHKKIQATGAQQMEVGEEDQFKGEVATQAPGETAFGDWIDITQRPEQTKWSSDNNVVATVNPETGLVKAVSPGVAKITVQWKNGTYWLTDSVTVAVGGVPLPEEPKEASVVCTPPQSAGTQTGKDMSAQPSGI
ncbi:Ig-like domain-containing protein, partial [Paenibacillus terreus]|uniref:Ig-like domain-containing protein n=1 Tax=Paenibacillus terreus TaxID=1387834 RepID=UPI0035CD3438